MVVVELCRSREGLLKNFRNRFVAEIKNKFKSKQNGKILLLVNISRALKALQLEANAREKRINNNASGTQFRFLERRCLQAFIRVSARFRGGKEGERASKQNVNEKKK